MNLQQNDGLLFSKSVPIRLKGAKLRRLKEAVIERDETCVWCNNPNISFAHIIRRSQGGDDSLENTMAACIPCHQMFDQYQTELPESVWMRMTIGHREEYVRTRRTIS